MPALVEEALQYFVDNPQSDYVHVLPAGQAHSGTETVFVRMSTFVPHFLAPCFLMEYRSPKVMLASNASIDSATVSSYTYNNLALC